MTGGPFKLVDQSTGQTATNPDGTPWENMDAPDGQYVELYAGTAPGSPNNRISPGAILLEGDTVDPPDPPDPPIDPIPPTEGNAMDRIDNATQLRDALMTYANEQRVGQCYSKLPIDIPSTITITQEHHDGTAWGVNGNFIKLNWTGPGGDDMLVYRGVPGAPNRGLVIMGLGMYGNGYAGNPAGSCLKLYAPEGDTAAIYRFTIRDVFTSWANHGIYLLGAVYEGLLDNCHQENHISHGINMDHVNVPSPTQAVCSNIAIMHCNSSRCLGAGMRQVYSTRSIFGSYIINGGGGIVAPDGIAAVVASNGENTGEMLFVPAYNGLGSTISQCEASTDGSTAQAGYPGREITPHPMLYGMPGNMGIVEYGNHITPYYNAVGNPNIRWLK
jgi:hypothetical protein